MRNYIVYGLIDPRTGKICYIGITKRGLKVRLKEHNKPKKTLTTIIYKIHKHLEKQNLMFSGVVLWDNLFKEEAELKEIETINYYSKLSKLYNEKPGGSVGFQSQRSRDQISVARKNHPNLNVPKGENHPNALLTEKQVQEIYRLIKKHYSNTEIISKLNLSIQSGSITNLRYGVTWNYLWHKNFIKPYPGFPTKQGGVPFRLKIKIIEWLDKGYSVEHISKWVKRVNKYDIKYASNRKIWKTVWNIYESLK